MSSELPAGFTIQGTTSAPAKESKDQTGSLPAGFTLVPETTDVSSGAPAGTRMAVASAHQDIDRLATIRKHFPDAQPYGEDNFIFTHPQTGKPTLMRPEGWMPTVGGAAALAPDVIEMLGGAAGAGMATAAGVPTAGASALAIPAAAGAGAATARGLWDKMAQQTLGTVDTRGGGEQAAEYLKTAGINAVAPAIGEKVGQVAAPYIEKGLEAMAPKTRALLDSFRNLGVEPSIASTVLPEGATKTLAKIPTAAGTMAEATEKQVGQLGAAVEDTASRIGNQKGSQQELGDFVKDSFNNAAERFRSRQEELYNNVWNYMGGKDAPVPINNVKQFLVDTNAEIRRAPETFSKDYKDAVERAEKALTDAYTSSPRTPQGTLPFDVVKQIRTNLGKDLESTNTSLAGSPKAGVSKLGDLYGALTEDLNAGAVSAGGNDAKKALDIANRYTRFNQEKNISFMDKLKDANPEDLITKVMSGASEGGSKLQALRRNLAPEEWDAVASTTLDRLGRLKPTGEGASVTAPIKGDFSATEFLKNWNNLSPEARKTLFGGSRYEDIIPRLNDVASVAAKLAPAEVAEKGAKSHGSMGAAGAVGLLAAEKAGEHLVESHPLVGGAIVTSALAAPWMTAKAMTNPAMINWLSRAAKAEDPNHVVKLIGQLGTIASDNKDIQGNVSGLYNDLAQKFLPQQKAPAQPAQQGFKKGGEVRAKVDPAEVKFHTEHMMHLITNNPDAALHIFNKYKDRALAHDPSMKDKLDLIERTIRRNLSTRKAS